MKRLIILALIPAFLLIGATNEVVIEKGIKDLRKIQDTNKIPVIDYNKIRKSISNFHFSPIYFYLSTDGCGSVAKKVKKEGIVDADICIGFNLIDAFHYIRLELITPDEAVFQTINIFVDNPDSPPLKIKYNNDHTPYNISKPIIIKGVSFIKSSIPVAGSTIQSQNLIGRWKMNIFIDEASISSGISEFEVE